MEFEDGNFDWGKFVAYNFDGEEGYLMYECPQVKIRDRLREEIRFVPIDGIREVRRTQGA
ncbi:hypothetical protein E5161_07445 [Cohnella pontilimi]|uniref:Uncharacterized protein n=1 Tax=Cohnella pontilimi TaxID=2564100 RepID=A0A4U0FCQ6_9BACL|nr:hypothetical protein [Cohnella pontilimi]TJY42676.1 hypothetical protein E5161_07445 [Cohnella pontilimi]